MTRGWAWRAVVITVVLGLLLGYLEKRLAPQTPPGSLRELVCNELLDHSGLVAAPVPLAQVRVCYLDGEGDDQKLVCTEAPRGADVMIVKGAE